MLVFGLALTTIAVGGMIAWSLHEIHRVDRIIDDSEKRANGEG